ncbi:MAG: NADH-quinone oxidoreductase subunit L [Candidatus Bathyarchaeia archaeon]
MERARGWFSVTSAIATLALVVRIMPDALEGSVPALRVAWSNVLGINLLFKMDELGWLFSLIAAFIGFLTILFSVKDLEGERDLGTYYMWMLVFIGSMIGLASSHDFISFFIFWELVSLCSWGLISFWKERPASVRASMKALLMTHLSSLPLLMAIIALYLEAGSFSMGSIAEKVAAKGASPSIVFASAMFIVAVVAKSAQVPLHTWLPDAMEAPTPVSALLHSATMVKAGVLLAARMLTVFTPLFIVGSSLHLFFASLGVLSMMVAIHMALVEKDLKRILAYSTISHIGFMMLGIGVGTALGLVGGLFHLLNHAMFKAALFLCAGSVIFRVGTRNVDEMGGLAKKMPITAASFLIAAFSASGVPPLSGFASKLMIYEAALTAEGPYHAVYTVYTFLAVYVSAVTLAVFMKAAYAIFFGQASPRSNEVKDSPPSMLLPIVVLAAASVLFGVFPQIPVGYLIQPALKAAGQAAAQLTVTWLGYVTAIGSYQAALIGLLLALSFILGGAIYIGGV